VTTTRNLRRPSSATKKVIAMLGVVGIIAVGAVVIGNLVSGHNAPNPAAALARIKQADSVLARSLGNFPSAVRKCGGQLGCVTGLVRTEAKAMETFNSQVHRISLSGKAATDAAALIAADNAVLQDLDRLGAATSNVQYLNVAKTHNLQQDVNTAGAAFAKLVKDLGGTIP
jgi:hypothetical protein